MDLLGFVDHGYVTPPPFFFNGPTDTPQHHIYSTTLIYSVRVPVPPYLECHIQINVNMFCCWWLAQPVTMATAQPPLLRHPSYLRLPHGLFHQGHHDHCTYVQTCWQIAVGGGTRAERGRQPEMRWEWNGANESEPEDQRWQSSMREEEIHLNCWTEKLWWWWTEAKEDLPSS